MAACLRSTRSPHPAYEPVKRTLDVVAASCALLLTSPVFTIISVAIRLDSLGPVFYRATRIGKGGRPFAMLKFRTMVLNADAIGGSSTPDDDPRLTRVGRMLRRYKLDELPQFINVLRGEMSLVGPRPQVAWAVNGFSPAERRILTIAPGMTDYASIRFRNEGEILSGSTDPDRDLHGKDPSREDASQS